jgi:hypothetical protein
MKNIWSIALNPTTGRAELMNLAGQEPARRPDPAGTGLVVRGALTCGRVRLDTSGCLRISGLLVP